MKVYKLYTKELQCRLGLIVCSSILSGLIGFIEYKELIFVLLYPYSVGIMNFVFLFTGFTEIIWNYIFISFFCLGLTFIFLLIYNYVSFVSNILEEWYLKKLKIYLFFGAICLYFIEKYSYELVLSKLYSYFIILVLESAVVQGNYELELYMKNYLYISIVFFLGISLLVCMVVFLLYKNWFSEKLIKKLRFYYVILVLLGIMVLFPPDLLLHIVVFSIFIFMFEIIVFGVCLWNSYYKN